MSVAAALTSPKVWLVILSVWIVLLIADRLTKKRG